MLRKPIEVFGNTEENKYEIIYLVCELPSYPSEEVIHMNHLNNNKMEAQLTKYFQKVIHNAAINYYKRKSKHYDQEMQDEQLLSSLVDITDPENEYLSTISLGEYSLVIQDEKLNEIVSTLNQKEHQFLIEKLVLGKTDQEIAVVFGISRQGVTNYKKRLYDKLKRKLNSVQ
ncbi:hypothetical protein IGI39_002073 [Enterococcus sp. AZ135]|uniref:sigma-70 family RNA polymerase sigma factor n=1 Tax=unclassified Enterococcus TaxID=2608891 RepID=UPI003F22B767